MFDDIRAKLTPVADRICTELPLLAQRTVEVARALMCDPKLLLLDEPTLGLAPTLVDVVFDLLDRLRQQGRTLLVVEQNATRALQLADRGYILRTGHLVAQGSGADLAADQGLFESFIGGADGA